MRPKHLELFLKIAIPEKWNTMIAGPPGCGKTDIVLAACRDLGVECILSHPVVSDPTDYKGLPFLTKGEDGQEIAKFLPFADLQMLVVANKPTVFFLDDLGQAPGSVQAAAMQLLLARRINDHKVSDHVSFIAATNRREDKAGVQGILEPVKSRFVTIITLENDVDDWTEWAVKNGMPAELIAYAKYRKHTHADLFKFTPSMSMDNSPCPRTVANVGRIINKALPDTIEFEVIQGAIGEAAATDLRTFLTVYRNLDDPDEVIKAPKTHRLPDHNKRPDIMFALLGAVAARVTKKNFENIVELSKRLPNEFSVMLIKDCVAKDQELSDSEQFISWAINHGDLLN